MQKVLLSVAVCLACLFIFCSCEQMLPENGFVGTWKFEDTENVTYRIVFSGTEVQMVRTVYKDSGRTEVDSENGTGRMAYTVAQDGTVTVGFNVGVTNETVVSYLFALSDSNLTWTVSRNGEQDPAKTLARDDKDHPFIDPDAGHEDYKCDFLDYSVPEGYCYIQNSILTLYYDGTFTWTGSNQEGEHTIACGTYVMEKEFLTLLSPDSYVFVTMTLEYQKSDNTLQFQYMCGGHGFTGPAGWAKDLEYNGNWYVDSF